MIVLSRPVLLPDLVIAAFGADHDWHGTTCSMASRCTRSRPTLYGADLRDWAWSFLHVQRMPVFYPIIPWIGVMAAGYVFARSCRFAQSAAATRTLLRLGGAITVGFVLLRARISTAIRRHWSVQSRARHDIPLLPQHHQVSAITPVPADDARSLRSCCWCRSSGARTGSRYVLRYLRSRAVLLLLHAHLCPAPGERSRLPGDRAINVPALSNPPFFDYRSRWGFGLPVVYGDLAADGVLLYPVVSLVRRREGTPARSLVARLPLARERRMVRSIRKVCWRHAHQSGHRRLRGRVQHDRRKMDQDHGGGRRCGADHRQERQRRLLRFPMVAGPRRRRDRQCHDVGRQPEHHRGRGPSACPQPAPKYAFAISGNILTIGAGAPIRAAPGTRCWWGPGPSPESERRPLLATRSGRRRGPTPGQCSRSRRRAGSGRGAAASRWPRRRGAVS